MALKAGRRGLNKRLVDAFGNLNGEAPSGDYYTKQQTDNKFETKTHVNNTFQKKTLEVPIEMLSGSKLTVEDALQGLNEEKANTENTYSKTEANDAFVSKVIGSVNGIFLSALYGATSERAINIDTINNPIGYFFRIQSDSHFQGTLPSNITGVNGFILLGFSSIKSNNTVEYGCQLLIPFKPGNTDGKIYIRQNGYSASGAAWGTWREIISTAIV